MSSDADEEYEDRSTYNSACCPSCGCCHFQATIDPATTLDTQPYWTEAGKMFVHIVERDLKPLTYTCEECGTCSAPEQLVDPDGNLPAPVAKSAS